MCCERIPDLIYLRDYDGDYQKYEDAAYQLYLTTLGTHYFEWNGKPIRHKKHPMTKDKSCTFWHITSEGPEEDDRTADLRRFERIAWPGYILSYCAQNCEKILVWKNKRGGKQRILIFCPEINYIVVLDERSDYCLFWTAYPLHGHRKKKLLKEYSEYVKKNA
ncbi:MAG: hypothetical protein IKJ77_06215 [Firmicutes bacterium]|nr:hypothetical protein [Bacillota bacterium]